MQESTRATKPHLVTWPGDDTLLQWNIHGGAICGGERERDTRTRQHAAAVDPFVS